MKPRSCTREAGAMAAGGSLGVGSRKEGTAEAAKEGRVRSLQATLLPNAPRIGEEVPKITPGVRIQEVVENGARG